MPKAFAAACQMSTLSSAVQLGAGGAGVATAYADPCRLGWPSLAIFDRETQRAEALAAGMSANISRMRKSLPNGDLLQAMQQASGLIHATPTGMAKYPGMPLPAEMLERRHWVAEIVYFPLETELLAEARRRGCLHA